LKSIGFRGYLALISSRQNLKTLEFSSLKNRMILFDSSNFHGVNNFGKKQKERLTLITFFTNIVRLDAPLRFHVNESTKL